MGDEAQLSAIKKCDSCGKFTSSALSECRHCGAELPFDQDNSQSGSNFGQSIVKGVKGAGTFVLGLGFLALIFGSMALCQVGYGTVRPYIPSPIRSIVGNDYEYEVAEYFDSVENSFGIFWEESEQCRVERDQPCLTVAVQKLYDDTDYLPATASWMGESHSNLREAIGTLLDLNIRSETEEPTLRVFDESTRAAEVLGTAIENWIETANE
jgi:hypothetical protein